MLYFYYYQIDYFILTFVYDCITLELIHEVIEFG